MSSKDRDNSTSESTWNEQTFTEFVDHFRVIENSPFARWRLWKTVKFHIPRYDEADIWYGDENCPFYVKLDCASPRNLAWDILHAQRNLPRYDCHLEIIGNDVRETKAKAITLPDDEDEDCSEELSQLTVIAYDAEKHFKKTPIYRQEIHNLLKCRGSPFVVQLLGRTKDGELVFPRYVCDLRYRTYMCSKNGHRIRDIKGWMLQTIACVEFLHSKGIVHRDLLARNILYSDQGLAICDLQCHLASELCMAYEIDSLNFEDCSTASDVFSLGVVLWECCFYNYPLERTMLLDTPPPPPFRDIFLRCTAKNPEDRPTLAQLRAMYEGIDIPGEDKIML